MSGLVVEGWFLDAMEQQLGQLMLQQRKYDLTVEELCDLMMDPSTHTGQLSVEEHRATLAVCAAILLRRLSQLDVVETGCPCCGS